jgi:hypothetical protein
MTSKKHFIAVLLVSFIALFYCGCAPETEIALKFAPQEAATYKSVHMFRKDYLFDQPSEMKKTEKVTEVVVEMVYEQSITDVDSIGNATADITIKSLKYTSTNSGTVQDDYDSSKKADSKSAFTKLIGKGYTIVLSPSGKVAEVKNIAPLRQAVKSGTDNRIAAGLLNNERIERRHEILALPDSDMSSLKVGSTWPRVVSSPKGVLMPKTYEKIYTVKKIDGKHAIIEMDASPTSKQADDDSKAASSAMGMFGSFFESDDTYTGQLVLNTETGKVLDYNEKFRAEYTAVDISKDQNDTKEPDVLELAFTQMYSTELID